MNFFTKYPNLKQTNFSFFFLWRGDGVGGEGARVSEFFFYLEFRSQIK